jgi:hypothetical protein
VAPPCRTRASRNFSRVIQGNAEAVWENLFNALVVDADHEYAMIDRIIVRAHQRSAAA